MNGNKVGRVSHFYDKIGVAVIELLAELEVGDVIHFVRGGEDLFSQEVISMQSEHQSVQKAKKGDAIGIKTDQKVKDGADVYKVTKEVN